MKHRPSKKDLEEYVRRWKKVRMFELNELRRMKPAQKFLQLKALMATNIFKKNSRTKAKEASLVRLHWLKLNKVMSHA